MEAAAGAVIVFGLPAWLLLYLSLDRGAANFALPQTVLGPFRIVYEIIGGEPDADSGNFHFVVAMIISFGVVGGLLLAILCVLLGPKSFALAIVHRLILFVLFISGFVLVMTAFLILGIGKRPDVGIAVLVAGGATIASWAWWGNRFVKPDPDS